MKLTIEIASLELKKPTVLELEYEARAVWGECPVCNAKHGSPCDGNDEEPLRVHMGRLQRAPFTMAIQPWD